LRGVDVRVDVDRVADRVVRPVLLVHPLEPQHVPQRELRGVLNDLVSPVPVQLLDLSKERVLGREGNHGGGGGGHVRLDPAATSPAGCWAGARSESMVGRQRTVVLGAYKSGTTP